MGRESERHLSNTRAAAPLRVFSLGGKRVIAAILRWSIYAGLVNQIVLTGFFTALYFGLSVVMLGDPTAHAFSWWPDILAISFFAASIGLLVGLVKRADRNWARCLLGGIAFGFLAFCSVSLLAIQPEDFLQPSTYFMVILPVLINGLIVLMFLVRPLYIFIFNLPE
ncbi:MAG: hypothetical protein AB7D57_14370 [Desulfovibrionaceae bacterium]